MPFFKIETNKRPAENNTQILKKMSEFISAILGKPEQYVMVSIETNKQMMFGGGSQPTAFVQLKSIGLPADKCPEFSDRICQFIEKTFDIKPERVFIDFVNIQANMFGWNRKTF